MNYELYVLVTIYVSEMLLHSSKLALYKIKANGKIHTVNLNFSLFLEKH